jgi:hypothetical protein
METSSIFAALSNWMITRGFNVLSTRQSTFSLANPLPQIEKRPLRAFFYALISDLTADPDFHH